jgi:hypothetical protein
MQKYIVEGTSPVSMAEAAAQAMAKASVHLSENHDIKISVLEMSALKGRGYKVVLEITVIPLGQRETVGSDGRNPEHVTGQAAAAAKDRERREEPEKSIKKRIVDHFRRRRGGYIDTPSIHLAQLTEDMLIGQISTEFMPRAQPVNLGPLHDPLAVQKPEDTAQKFQQATQPDPDPPPAPEKKPGGPAADPD